MANQAHNFSSSFEVIRGGYLIARKTVPENGGNFEDEGIITVHLSNLVHIDLVFIDP